MLKIENFSKSFGEKVIVNKINFQINSNEIVSLVGKSGCGKTTIANSILGFDKFNEGKIFWYNTDISSLPLKQAKQIICTNFQMIFQNAQNVLHPIKSVEKIFEETKKSMAKYLKANLFMSSTEALEIVGLSDSYLKKKTYEMSGGEKQRVSIARAMLVRPRIIIADEPLSSIDVISQVKIAEIFKNLVNNGISILFISHDLDFAYDFSNRILLLKDKQIVEYADLSAELKNQIIKELAEGLK